VSEAAADSRTIDLLESLKPGQWLKIPMAAMREVGAASQTLAGLLKLTNKETFVSLAAIATSARVARRTCQLHLVELDSKGWIKNHGRQRTRRGNPRRTCTYTVQKKTIDALSDYGVLPWWACAWGNAIARHVKVPGKKKTEAKWIAWKHLNWASRALLSIIMARLMGLKAGMEQVPGEDVLEEDFWGLLDNMGGHERFRFSLVNIQRQTGLTSSSIVQAKRELKRRKIIDWIGPDRKEGSTSADILWPSSEFQVTVKEAGNNTCYVSF
jgi:hypothetical protein